MCQTAWLDRGRRGARRPRGRARARDQPVRVRVDPAGQRGQRRPQPQLHRLRRARSRRTRATTQLAAALVPPTWDRRRRSRRRRACCSSSRPSTGSTGCRRRCAKGQYRHPTGRLLRRRRARSGRSGRSRRSRGDARAAPSGTAIVDLHTGLGPFGVGELIASHPDDAGKDRLDAWYGDYTLPSEGTSVSADVSGDVLDALDVWVEGPRDHRRRDRVGDRRHHRGVERAAGRRVAARARRSPRARGRADQGRSCGPRSRPTTREWADLVWDRFTEVAERSDRGPPLGVGVGLGWYPIGYHVVHERRTDPPPGPARGPASPCGRSPPGPGRRTRRWPRTRAAARRRRSRRSTASCAPRATSSGSSSRPSVGGADRAARGRELVEVLELAAQFPGRHAAALEFPRFGRRVVTGIPEKVVALHDALDDGRASRTRSVVRSPSRGAPSAPGARSTSTSTSSSTRRTPARCWPRCPKASRRRTRTS